MEMKDGVYFGARAKDFGVDENLAGRAQALRHAGNRFSVQPDFDHFVWRRVAHARFGGTAGAHEDAVRTWDTRADMPTQPPRQLHLAEHAAGFGYADANVVCVSHECTFLLDFPTGPFGPPPP